MLPDILLDDNRDVFDKYHVYYGLGTHSWWKQAAPLNQMTAREALAIIAQEIENVHNGGHQYDGGAAYRRAWEVLDHLVFRMEGLSK